MSPLVSLLIVLAFLLVVGVVLGFLGIWLAVKRQRQHDIDEMLLIKPPRPYKDPDGRSNFRPELRERTAARRGGAR